MPAGPTGAVSPTTSVVDVTATSPPGAGRRSPWAMARPMAIPPTTTSRTPITVNHLPRGRDGTPDGLGSVMPDRAALGSAGPPVETERLGGIGAQVIRLGG